MAAGIEWNEGWPRIEAVINRMIVALEAEAPLHVTSEDYMTTYRLIYDMCVQHRPREYSDALYDAYHKCIEGYALSRVLPTLVREHSEFLLRDFVRRWSKHEELVKWLSRFFSYLERFYLVRNRLPALTMAGQRIFLDVVYDKVKDQVTVATLSMIHQEREGNLIDGCLLKNVLDTLVNMGAGSMEFYELDFEKPMLSNTAVYYSQKAAKWILAYSFTDYMDKANDCLKQEEHRAFRYFQNCSKQKLLELVHHELFLVHARQLEEMRIASHITEEETNQSLVQKCERLAL